MIMGMMYVDSEFEKLVSDIAKIDGKSKKEVTKDIAEFIRREYIKKRYEFRLFR